jgi:DNA-binding MarR family transcriptional regulator
LVAVGSSSNRRAKEVALTGRGRARIRQALPHWRRAQREFLAGLGGARWANLAGELQDLLFLVSPAV